MIVAHLVYMSFTLTIIISHIFFYSMSFVDTYFNSTPAHTTLGSTLLYNTTNHSHLKISPGCILHHINIYFFGGGGYHRHIWKSPLADLMLLFYTHTLLTPILLLKSKILIYILCLKHTTLLIIVKGLWRLELGGVRLAPGTGGGLATSGYC
jgi:hypothetical protein